MDVRAENLEKVQPSPGLRLVKEPDIASQINVLGTEITTLQTQVNALKNALSFFLSAAPGEKGYEGPEQLYPISSWVVRSMSEMAKGVSSLHAQNQIDARQLDQLLAMLQTVRRELRPGQHQDTMNLDDISYQLQDLKLELEASRSRSHGVFFTALILISMLTLFVVVYVGSSVLALG